MNSPGLAPLSLDMIVKHINHLPRPSATIGQLLRCLDDENASAGTLARIIANDQALVARLLRIANSPFYGLRGKVETIPDAIAVLGLRAVHTLATASAFSETFDAISAEGFEPEIYRRHSLATAIAARTLARRMNLGEGGAFVAGLLHDLGRLMLACFFPAHWEAAIRYQESQGCSYHVAEKTVAGIDHGEIGGILGERWHFPAAICQAMAMHHRPEEVECTGLVLVVHLGDALAHALDLSEDVSEVVPQVSEACWMKADLAWRDSQEIFGEIEREYRTLTKVLLN
ncbi:MAG: hypothetical protein H6R13_3719 [Proteobacteria bacterium]|nr:hypothetical protein [Pseudomonadota bacterium]